MIGRMMAVDGARRRIFRERPARVLVVDYSIGFGGATKGMALMLQGIPEIEFVIITSQELDVSDLWYDAWPTYRFRRTINYRSRWQVREWAGSQVLPRITTSITSKMFAAADTYATFMGAFQMLRLIRRHRIDLVEAGAHRLVGVADAAFSGLEFRRTMGRFATGVCIATTEVDGQVGGCDGSDRVSIRPSFWELQSR